MTLGKSIKRKDERTLFSGVASSSNTRGPAVDCEGLGLDCRVKIAGPAPHSHRLQESPNGQAWKDVKLPRRTCRYVRWVANVNGEVELTVTLHLS